MAKKRQRVLNLLRGIVRIEVEHPYPERFVNLCAQNGVEFWGMERDGLTMRAYTHISGFKRLRTLTTRAGFTVRRIKKSGAPFFLWRMRKRYILLAGLAAILIATRVLSLFVWEIDVRGNENVPNSVILQSLKELGFTYGAFGPSVASEPLANDMLLAIPELSWFAVNIAGSHADVLVRERVPKPVTVDKRRPMMVCARKSGVIASVSVLDGAQQVTVGDTVQAGDLLVSGIVPSKTNEPRHIHARAEIWARTWYEFSEQIPLETDFKSYTGQTIRRRALIIGGKTINFNISSGIMWSNYDRISVRTSFRSPFGGTLPIALVTDIYDEYVPVGTTLGQERAERILQARLRARLNDELRGETVDGDAVAVRFTSMVEGGVLTVTMNAECLEQIAVERDFTESELGN
ncbi:MAG: sporulation protein YqfD [Oscillospiraceae bacterium]|jgi:similar to stage IV sporulation protein|nr:sporulation protein YqfD [Oscillospiraceae bacterium]